MIREIALLFLLISTQALASTPCGSAFRGIRALDASVLFSKAKSFGFRRLFGRFYRENFKRVIIEETLEGSATLDGVPLRELHAPGGYNFAILAIEDSGPPRVIKVYNQSVYQLKRFVRGNLLQSLAGGPKVYGFGEVEWFHPSLGWREHFYIILEHLLPEARRTHSVKNEHEDFVFYYNERMANELAGLIVRLLESETEPRDLDLIFDKSGNMRWVDGDFWVLRPGKPLNIPKLVWRSISVPKTHQQALYDKITDLLHSSEVLSPKAKATYLRQLEAAEPRLSFEETRSHRENRR